MRKRLLVYSALVYVRVSNAELSGIVSVMTRGGPGFFCCCFPPSNSID